MGKVREVFPHSAQVLAINDQTSGAGVILETTRIRGILRGNAAGQPQIVGILNDQRIQPGEKVLTAGGDLIFPRGLPVGVVEKVVRDPDRDSFIDVIVKPAAHLDRLDEVLVITSTEPRFSAEQQQDMATSEALKGAEAEAIKEQQKASQIMAERLPGLTDPNAPAANPAQRRAWQLRTRTEAAPRPRPSRRPRPSCCTARILTALRRDYSRRRARQAQTETGRQARPANRTAKQPQPAEESIAMSVLGADHRRDLGIRRYPLLVYALMPLAALVLQAWLPRLLRGYAWFDLPLVVTVYFALGRRDPIQGTLMGAGMGLFEDALTHHAIGVNGIAKTVAGFLAGSVGVRIDVENHTIRLMLTFLLSLLSSAIYVFIYRVLLGLDLEWSWLTELMKAVGNSLIAAGAVSAAGPAADQGVKGLRNRER